METVKRIVTGHDERGNAVFRSCSELRPALIESGDAAFATVWSTAEVPVNLNDETDGGNREVGLTLEKGSVVRVVDMLPGGISPMHRTVSIDYGVVLSGEVELELDDGRVERCEAGDVIVQRGTMHRWRNPSHDTPCRIVFVLIEARKAYQHEGEFLKAFEPWRDFQS
jgi:quercetin dioxygenase-like cupin family protein